jgi:superfamily I DNA/RNA helicase
LWYNRLAVKQITLLASSTFLRACEDVRHDQRFLEAVDECVQRLATNPRHPGLHTEKLTDSHGIDVHSARVNLQFRLIFAWVLPERMVLLHVDKGHDDAYVREQRLLGHLDQLVERAVDWKGTASAVAPSKLPRLDEYEPIPISGVEALREMLVGGMQNYLAYLDPTQLSYATFDFGERAGLTFIRGGAGTGKTAIAIHRALHLVQQPEFDRDGVQYICFNNVLQETVQDTVTAVWGSRPKDLNVSTFHSWCGTYLKTRGRSVDLAPENALAWQVRRAKQRLFPGEEPRSLHVSDIVSEIKLIKRCGLTELQDYVDFDRAGQRFPLRRVQREAIWQIFEEVRYEAGGPVEYDDLPAIALNELAVDEEFTGYRAVIVDEAQDCTPVMAQLVFKMVRDDHRRLMFLADPAQAIYPNHFALTRREFASRRPWNVVLRTPYRSTCEIYAFASSLYVNVPEIHADVRELRDGSSHGPRPVISVYGARTEADTALVAAIRGELAPEGELARRPEEIAVLVSSNAERSRVLTILESAGIEASFIDRSNVNLDAPCVKVLTVHAAKGLDFPSVYLYRFYRLGEPSLEDRALFYVGLTRSSFSLSVFCDRDTLSPLLHDLDPETYDLSGTAHGLLAV